jgi:hypothetical protein
LFLRLLLLRGILRCLLVLAPHGMDIGVASLVRWLGCLVFFWFVLGKDLACDFQVDLDLLMMESVLISEGRVILFQSYLTETVHETGVDLGEVGRIMSPNEGPEILEAFSLGDELPISGISFIFMDFKGTDHDLVEGFFEVFNLVAVKDLFQSLLMIPCG